MKNAKSVFLRNIIFEIAEAFTLDKELMNTFFIKKMVTGYKMLN